MSTNFEDLYAEYAKWQIDTFGNRPYNKETNLALIMEELLEIEAEEFPELLLLEYIDVINYCFAACVRMGFNSSDVLLALRSKLDRNKAAKWIPDEKGTFRRIK